MHSRQRLTDPGAVRVVGFARPDAFQKRDDRRRPAGQAAERLAALVLDRLRTADAAYSVRMKYPDVVCSRKLEFSTPSAMPL